jgi:hypothetical protein
MLSRGNGAQVSDDWDDYCPTKGDDYSVKKELVSLNGKKMFSGLMKSMTK